MILRTSRASAAGLLSHQTLQPCREPPLSVLRTRDFLPHDTRCKSTSHKPPRFKRKPAHSPKPRRRESEYVPIDVSFLGEQGRVVLVPDRPHRVKKPQARVEPEELRGRSKDASRPLLLEEIEKKLSEDEEFDSELVNARIESYRSSCGPGDNLGPGEWDELRWKVESSFTGHQLTDYIKEVKGQASSSSLSPSATGETEIPDRGGKIRVTEWRPGTSRFLDTTAVDVSKRIAGARSLKGKQLLAERVLRECWRLGIEGEVGQLDVRLPSSHLSLLANSKHFSFGELANLHSAKIDLTHSLGLVRVTGSQYVCENITEVIRDTTVRIQEEDVRLLPSVDNKLRGGYAFTPEFLDWTKKTYGVSFDRVSPYYGPQKILYLTENRQGMEDARRVLNLAVYSTNPEPIPFTTYIPASEPANIYSLSPEEHVSWFERQKVWFRWAMSSTQTLMSKPLHTPIFDQHQKKLPDELLKLLRKPSTESPGPSNAVNTHETITAAVGKSLFLHKPSIKANTVDASQLGKMGLPRTFTTDLPRVASFLRLLMPLEVPDQQRLHRIQLVPSAIHAGIFPSLDLEVSLQQKDEPSSSIVELVLHSAKATLSQNSVDYLLPENGLDLRFTRTLQHDLLSDESREASGPLVDAVHKCLSGVYATPRPRGTDVPLPSFLPLSVPKALLLAEEKSTSRKQADESTSEAEYMFLPINDRRGTLLHRYDFHDQRLNYSYYESGPFNPPRAMDLYLDIAFGNANGASPETEAAAVSDSEATGTLDKFRTFYGSACRLAFDLDAAWRSDV